MLTRLFCLRMLIVLALASLAGLAPAVVETKLQMVKELNVTPATALGSPVSYQGKLFFALNDGKHGAELWSSDGTTAGTTLFKELAPGAQGSNPELLTVIDGTLYFKANDGTGVALWKSDGTVAGTAKYKAIHPARILGLKPSGYTKTMVLVVTAEGKVCFINEDGSMWDACGPLGFNATGDTCFFINYSHGYTLSTNTQGYVESQPLVTLSQTPQNVSTLVENGIYYCAYNYEGYRFLLRSDGTAAGTTIKSYQDDYSTATLLSAGGKIFVRSPKLLQAIDRELKGSFQYIGSPDSSNLETVAVGSNVFYVLDGPLDEGMLCIDNGTGPNQVLFDLIPGFNAPDPSNLTAGDKTLYFSARVPGGDWALWKTDGTAAGTLRIKDFTGSGYESPNSFIFADGKLFFSALHPQQGLTLWQSDGTAAGTVKVAGVQAATPGSNPRYLGVAGGLAYFAANDGVHGEEPWITDGTATGTRLLKDLNPGSTGSLPGYDNLKTSPVVANFTSLGEKAFFSATTLAKEMDPYGNHDWFPSPHLWRSDGTTAGTETIKYYTARSQFPLRLTPFNDKVFFLGYDLGSILGVDATSTTAREYHQTNDYHLAMEPVMPLGEFLLYFGETGGHPDYLRRTDGTMVGTVAVKRFLAEGTRIPYGVSSQMVKINGEGYFFVMYATDSGTPTQWQIQLWKTDGWPGNTKAIQAIPSVANAPASTAFYGFTSATRRLFFKALDESHGNELWVSDGTSATTRMVKDITPGTAGTTFGGDIEIGPYLIFAADDGAHGAELWRSDGTASGTVMIQDLNAGAAGSNPVIAGMLGDALLIAADDGTHGRELWKLEGPDYKTLTPVREINPAGSANPRNFFAWQGTLYFSADDRIHGEELWRTDGTAGGTMLVGDINPGAGSAAPGNFFIAGDQLLFSADDGSHGRELWSFSEHVTSARPGWRKYE